MNVIRLRNKFDFAAFDGSAPLPAHTLIHNLHTKNSSPQRIRDAHTLPSDLRSLIQRVEEHSLSSPDMQFRESGAGAFYRDGTLEDIIVSSDLPVEIGIDDNLKQISFILDAIDAGHIPERIADIHTHPSIEYKPDHLQTVSILINNTDLDMYRFTSSLLSYYAGRHIPMTGIVRPVGKTCGDVIIQTHIDTFHPDRDAYKAADELKRQRTGQGIVQSPLSLPTSLSDTSCTTHIHSAPTPD